MLSLYEQLQFEGYDFAIALHLSSGLSGTFESAKAASEMTDFKVYSIYSKIGNDLFANGKDVEEVVATINEITSKSKLSFIPSSLNQLHKSGRVSGTQNFLSNLLDIKVVISFENGKPVMKEKIRSNKRAKNYVNSLLRTDMNNGAVPEVAVINCNNAPDADIWKNELFQEFPTLKVQVVPLSICVGVHAGEGTTGLSWVTY